jgi:hypothetical protein
MSKQGSDLSKANALIVRNNTNLQVREGSHYIDQSKQPDDLAATYQSKID